MPLATAARVGQECCNRLNDFKTQTWLELRACCSVKLARIGSVRGNFNETPVLIWLGSSASQLMKSSSHSTYWLAYSQAFIKATVQIRSMTLATVRDRVVQIIREEFHLNVDEAARSADEYIRFMQLKVEHPAAHLAPSHTVDSIWHSHILDTRSYQQFQSILMPGGGFLHHNPVHADQPNYEMRYANTLSLLTKKHGDSLDADNWPIDSSEYKKLNIMVTRTDSRKVATAGPHVYCHKRLTVLQMVDSIKLVMGYAATDRVIISGMKMKHLPKSTQQVSKTVLWASTFVRVTPFTCAEAGAFGDRSIKTRGDIQLRYFRFDDETADVQVRFAQCCASGHCAIS
jgi:hypothetical protein